MAGLCNSILFTLVAAVTITVCVMPATMMMRDAWPTNHGTSSAANDCANGTGNHRASAGTNRRTGHCALTILRAGDRWKAR
jgi:hypothetical protein